MPDMRIRFTALLVGCLTAAALIAGCGSSSSSSTSATTTEQTTPSAPANEAGGGKEAGGNGTAPTQAPESQSGGHGTGEEFGKNDPYSAPKGGDNSIQTYGSEASGGEKAAATKAMFAFLRAMAAKNYAKVCEGVSSQTREGVEKFAQLQHKTGSCSSLLGTLLGKSPGGVSEAKKAAEGTVGHVRIGGGNAFVLFTPKGGKPSYFVMKKEGGTWKATGFNTGAPLTP